MNLRIFLLILLLPFTLFAEDTWTLSGRVTDPEGPFPVLPLSEPGPSSTCARRTAAWPGTGPRRGRACRGSWALL